MHKIDFKKPIHIYFMGIGGISMSGLAEILLKEQFQVSGSDAKSSDIIDRLTQMGVTVYIGQRASNITDDIDLVVYTAAIKKDNLEFEACVKKGIPMITRAQLLGQIMSNYKYPIAISGTHGKTTTTSMLTQILLEADTDPTITVGGILDCINGNICVGKSDYFVAEACEYTNSFHEFHPYISIILNIEADHLDFFSGIEEIIDSFQGFARKLPDDGLLIINGDMDCLERVTKDLKTNITTFGLQPFNHYSATDIVTNEQGHIQYTLVVDGTSAETVMLNVGGSHNVLNSLSTLAVSDALGISRATAISGLGGFCNAKRRFEYKGSLKDITIIDDYAHHPTEIKATLATAKNTLHNELWVVFQPHTYTRTKALLNDFAEALHGFDHVILTDIYAAREKNTGKIHSKDLMEQIKNYGTDVHYFSSFDLVEKFLLENCKKNDLLITMGAGDVVSIGEHLLGK